MLLNRGTEQWFKHEIERCRRDVEAFAALEGAVRFFKMLVEKHKQLDSTCRCALHHAAVVSYARPFIKVRGKHTYPFRELKKTPKFDLEVHNQILQIRNCLIAHVDEKYQTSRLVTLDAAGDLNVGSTLKLQVSIPVEIVAIGVVVDEAKDPALCRRYQDHAEACMRKVAEIGHKHLDDLQREWIKHPEHKTKGFFAKDSIPFEPDIKDEMLLSLPALDISKHRLGHIPEPELILGKDGYMYRRTSLFVRYKDWELIIGTS